MKQTEKHCLQHKVAGFELTALRVGISLDRVSPYCRNDTRELHKESVETNFFTLRHFENTICMSVAHICSSREWCF